jgi:hypothetical protein
MGVNAPMSVMGEVTISSPGSGSMAATAVWTAAVPEARACVRDAGSRQTVLDGLDKVPRS